jgi:Ca2+-binding RTX toxin-like protein
VLDVYVDAFTALGGSITANKAAVVDIEIDGAVSNVITAAAATGVTVLQNNKTVSSTLDLVAAAATSLEVISAGTLTLSSGFTDLGNLQTLNVDTAQSFTLYKDIAAANSVTLSGAGDVTLMNVGATTNGYSLTVDASDLDGDLTTGNLAVGTGQNINLNLSTLGGTAMIGSGFSDALTATTGAVAIDASEAMGAIEVGNILAKNVTVDAGGSLGSFQSGLISASSSVTYVGTELFGSTADITATGSILTVDFTGGLANDEIDIAVGTGVATKSIVVTGAMDLATTNNYLEIDASPSTVTAGVTITYSSLTGYEIASVVGSSGADTITAGDGNDVIRGRDGADIIYGSLGADEIYGNEGNDQLYGEFGDDSLNGGQGDDTVWGGDGNDYILGGSSGNDLLYGNNGDDFVDGDVGSDTIFGGSGNDTIKGGEDADQLSGGGGANEFFYGPLGAISTQTGITIATADRITDFSGAQGDRIDTSLAGTSSNYAEAANVTDFTTALAAANSAFLANGNLYYYLTSSTSDGGLLFIDNGAAIGADAVIVLSGISSANFEYAFII